MDIDGNNTLYIKGVWVVISTFETPPTSHGSYLLSLYRDVGGASYQKESGINSNEEAIRKGLRDLNVCILFDYPTKSGRHMVTEPFNPALLPAAEIKQDGLLLLSY